MPPVRENALGHPLDFPGDKLPDRVNICKDCVYTMTAATVSGSYMQMQVSTLMEMNE